MSVEDEARLMLDIAANSPRYFGQGAIALAREVLRLREALANRRKDLMEREADGAFWVDISEEINALRFLLNPPE